MMRESLLAPLLGPVQLPSSVASLTKLFAAAWNLFLELSATLVQPVQVLGTAPAMRVVVANDTCRPIHQKDSTSSAVSSVPVLRCSCLRLCCCSSCFAAATYDCCSAPYAAPPKGKGQADHEADTTDCYR